MVQSDWAENTRRNLEALDPDETVILVPVGAVEQHGTHLPVGTDAIIAEHVARTAAERSDRALAVPALPYGYSPHHGGVPGTLTLSSETYLGVVTDILGSLVDEGFEQIAVLNGHGGNRSLLKTAVSDFRDDRNVSVAVISYWDLVADDVASLRDSPSGGVSHGGELETSLVLYLRDDLVGDDRDDFVRDNCEGYRRTDLFGSGAVYYPQHFDEMTASGVSGHPSAASREKGERVFERSVEALVDFVESYTDW